MLKATRLTFALFVTIVFICDLAAEVSNSAQTGIRSNSSIVVFIDQTGSVPVTGRDISFAGLKKYSVELRGIRIHSVQVTPGVYSVNLTGEQFEIPPNSVVLLQRKFVLSRESPSITTADVTADDMTFFAKDLQGIVGDRGLSGHTFVGFDMESRSVQRGSREFSYIIESRPTGAIVRIDGR